MRPALVLALVLAACGGPVVDETTSPAGVVIDAVADPEVYEGCRATHAEAQALLRQSGCSCETECPEPLQPLFGRCVTTAEALAVTEGANLAGACVDFMAASQRAQGCEVPVWPLARCASVD